MEEALIKRILPHSIEAEQSVIGSMILDRDAILVASEILTSDDFYQSQYGIIFDAMVELCNEGKPVDLITLQNRLKEKDLPPDISSMEYVRDLISAVPTSANVKYYANIVSEKAVLRRLIKVNEEVENSCYLEKDSTQMILEDAEKKLYGHKANHVMKTDIKEMNNGYELVVDLPGFKKDEVHAALENGYLTISAEKGLDKDEKEKETGRYIRRERYAGACSRSFYVGKEVHQDDIKAEFKHGILTLFVPKKEAKPAVEQKHSISIEG